MVQRRTGVVRELGDQVEQGVLQWFELVERIEGHSLKMIRSDVSSTRPRGKTTNMVDGLCEERLECKKVIGTRKSDCA